MSVELVTDERTFRAASSITVRGWGRREPTGAALAREFTEVIRDLDGSSADGRLTVKEIASFFADRHGDDYERKVTAKWVGGILRKKLNLKPRKSNGVFVIPPEENPKLVRLYEKYGVSEPEADAAAGGGPDSEGNPLPA